MAAWFGFCRREMGMFRALVQAYEPKQRLDAAFRRELLALTFLHRFGALIVAELWQADPLRDNSLSGLQNWLWPLN
mgnify:CR=1 FL=1